MWITAWLNAIPWDPVVAALAHSLWQGALVSLVLLAILRLVPATHAARRYAICCAALAVLIGGVAGTVALLEFQATLPPIAPPSTPSTESIESTPSTRSTPSTPAILRLQHTPWQRIAADLWLFGVALMLVRALRLQWRAARLPRACEPVQDPALLEAVRGIARQLGVGQAVRVLSGPDIAGPAVLGCFSPVILLPAAALSGVPEPILRAAIAHEIAHIRRYDYLINQIQLLIEALLFFNPAVWWISRQIRVEREACCDALAARTVGGELDYAKSLAAWGEWAGAAPALAITASNRGSLLDRIQRLLDRGYVPSLSRSWLGAALLCGAAAAILAVFTGGSFVATLALARALTPAERLAAVEAVAAEHDPGANPFDENGDPRRSVRLRVRVESEDASALPEETGASATVDLNWKNRGYSAAYSMYVVDDEDAEAAAPNLRHYTMNVIEGIGYVCASAPGFANAFAGPIQLDPDTEPEEIVLTLTRGFTSQLRLKGAGGEPLAGATLNGSYDRKRTRGEFELVTDALGMATIEHVADAPIRWRASATGYEVESRSIAHRPGETDEWQLTPALETTGQILDEATGDPIPNATLWEIARAGGPEPISPSDDENLTLLGRTGPDGRFSLNSLRRDTRYAIMAETESGARAFLENVRAGDTDRTLSMPAALHIRGTVRGALERLPRRRGTPYISFQMILSVAGHTTSSFPKAVPVHIEGGTGAFQVSGLWRGPLNIEIPGLSKRVDLVHSIDDLVLDVPPETPPAPERDVIIRFKGTEGAQPTGSMLVNYRMRPEDSALGLSEPMAIENGEVRLRVPVPNTIAPNVEGVLGYWFSSMQTDVPPGDGPFVLELDTVPAGSIYGSVSEADGSPARGVFITLTVVEPPPVPAPHYHIPDPKPSHHRTDLAKDFMATPVPLGGTYRVVLRRDHSCAVSRAIQLTEHQPTAAINLSLAEGLTMRGRVSSENGEPLAGVEITLSLQIDGAGRYSGPPVSTAADGTFTIRGVNPDVDGTYELQLRPPGAFVSKNIRDFSLSRDPVDFRLAPGVTVTGRVLAPDGRPAVQAKVRALPWDDPTHSRVEEETTTDGNGAFQFRNLAPEKYHFVVTDRAGNWSIREDLLHPSDLAEVRHVELTAE
jgi:beta-lactamase regulating signal transducer with metallopeptidase domain